MTQATEEPEKARRITSEDESSLEELVTETNELNEDEKDLLEGDRTPRAAADADPLDAIPSPTEPPAWAIIPKSIKFPPAGCQVAFLRVPAKWCRDPAKGDLQCILWALDERDEVLAYQRCRGDQIRSVHELSKQTIRAIDGMMADWSGENTTGNVSRFWRDIGPKGRAMVRNYYVRTHSVDPEEAVDFFSNHFAVVTVQKA